MKKRLITAKIAPCPIGRFVLAVLLAAAIISPAAAQVPNARFSTANPARVQEQLPAKENLPTEIPGLQIQQLKAIEAPVGADQVKFKLERILFEGVTVYKRDELHALYAGKSGTMVSLADIYGLAAALTRKYRDDGYILTQVVVPPQTIEKGIVHLRAVEGFLHRIDVENGDGDLDKPLDSLVYKYLGRIQRKGPLNGAELERALLLINDIPGVHARAILSPSKTATGGSDLQVILFRKGYDGEISVDNFGTRYMGPVQYNVTASLNSQIIRSNEKLTVQGIFAPDNHGQKELLYLSLSYLQPLGASGTTLQLTGTDTTTHPGYLLEEFDVKGTATSLAGTYSYPFVRSRNINLNGHATFDYHDISTTTNLVGDSKRADHLRALRIGGRFQALDTVFGPAFSIAEFEWSRGLDILEASRAGLATLSRPSGVPTFTKINAELQRLQHIIDGVNLLTSIKGQMTRTALLSSEQFGIGGTSYGRGYDPSEITGDRGFSGKVELQWNQPYRVHFLQDYQLYAFWDAGEVRNVKTTADTAAISAIASTGMGARLTIDTATTAGLVIAFPLTKDVQTKKDRSPAAYLNLSRSF